MTAPVRIIGSAELPGVGPVGSGVICYARVSSEQDTRQTLSPDAQIEAMRAYCRLHSLGEPSIVTERKSAKNLRGRPEFLRILALVRAGQVRHLVVCEITRLSRDLGDARAVFDTLTEHGVELHGATRAIDLKTADGSFVTHLDALLGERERRKLGERIKFALTAKPRVKFDPKDNPAMQAKAMKGMYLGGPAPLGWRWKKQLQGDRMRVVGLEEHPREMRMIRRIFELKRTGLSYRQVAQMIAKEGYRTRRGGFYPFRRIEAIMHTKELWGVVNGSGTPGRHEPVGASADAGATGGTLRDGAE